MVIKQVNVSSEFSLIKRIRIRMDILKHYFYHSEPADKELSIIDALISDKAQQAFNKTLSLHLSDAANSEIAADLETMEDLEAKFLCFKIQEDPISLTRYLDSLIHLIVLNSSKTWCPKYIGHMTSALPSFFPVLAKLLTALNQNVVKSETSRSFTPLERQVLANLHHLAYQESDEFYSEFIHSAEHSLGNICSGGTIANITALWVARNRQFLASSHKHLGTNTDESKEQVIIVSERGHYSLAKAVNILGLSADKLITIPTDEANRIRIDLLEEKCKELLARNIDILSIVGIAGNTETGNIDPLTELAKIARKYFCHFHVDAAWGGATLFSRKHIKLLEGIEMADSITIDAHKQMYLPIGCGIVLFRDPSYATAIKYSADYILREGSNDLGHFSLEGSRPGVSLLIYSSMKLLGRSGYEMLVDQSIDKAKKFASIINKSDDFELCSEPEVCILTYRYVDPAIRTRLQDGNQHETIQVNRLLSRLNVEIQKRQLERGISFVSRTKLSMAKYFGENISVLRVVLANPLTTTGMLREILEEQREIARGIRLEELTL